MKYILISFLFLIGCMRPPTEGEIEEVALKQTKLTDRCNKIGMALDGKSQMLLHTTDGAMCAIYLKNNVIDFNEDETLAIGRFLYIQK